MTERIVRIGGAAGFWGDSPDAINQIMGEDVDYIILDYLAEVTMAILARARSRKADSGYASDFVDLVMRSVFERKEGRTPRIVTNAGGINPVACRDALLALAGEFGRSPTIAIVEGDDLLAEADRLAAMNLRDIDRGEPFPDKPWSVNAYLGALPIAKAISDGADIVITGRCADSALVLGPLIAEFGWSATDYNLLAAGSLAGHVIECGCQATGGNFTDWRDVEGWDNMGFPIVECGGDGTFVLTKPANTGGLVSPLSVGEQVVYEIGDPQTYILPDVVCDFTGVTLEQAGPDRVRIAGARGRQPTDRYKVSATFQDGYRSTAMFTLCGRDAVAKAERVGAAILSRTRRMFAARGLKNYRRTDVKILGTEHQYGTNANPHLAASREVVLRMDVHHDQKEALEIFAREIAPAGLAMAPGRCGLFGGRPSVSPLIRHRAFLVPKDQVRVTVDMGSNPEEVVIPGGTAMEPAVSAAISAPSAGYDGGPTRVVPLSAVACARSGDKGDSVNIGVIARAPDLVPVLKAQLTAPRVRDYFGGLVVGPVERFELPGLGAFNFLLKGALGGGGTSSLRNDPQGKTFAQMLLDIEIEVPASLEIPC
jgi:hypothetical protein